MKCADESVMRYVFAAGASALVLPVANSIGWGLTMTIAAIISVSTPDFWNALAHDSG